MDIFTINPVVDAAEVLANFPAAKGVDLADETVEELAVVAYDDGCAVEGSDGFLQHVLRGHVEVVGRLVEYQQVHWLQE